MWSLSEQNGFDLNLITVIEFEIGSRAKNIQISNSNGTRAIETLTPPSRVPIRTVRR